MIVVHPKDPSTKFLHLMYEDIGGVLFFDSISQREQILEAIRNAPKDEYILLLGHGTPHGLLGGFIGDGDAELLRDRPNLVGIWCYASSYAYKHGLMGFFSGMFISEWYEAEANEVTATPDEIDEMCWAFAGMFGDLLRAGYPLVAIAADLMSQNNINSDLTHFNYNRLTYRRTGMENLPVREEYWGYEDVSIEDNEIVSKGVETIKKEINSRLWQGLDIWEDFLARDYFVHKVERDCLRQLLGKYQAHEEELYKPTPKEIAKYLTGMGIVCDRMKTTVFGPASYVIHRPGRFYSISRMKGDDTCCIEFGPHPLFTVRNLRIYLKPQTFFTLFNHLNNRIIPLILPAIEDYCYQVKKKILVRDIRATVRENK